MASPDEKRECVSFGTPKPLRLSGTSTPHQRRNNATTTPLFKQRATPTSTTTSTLSSDVATMTEVRGEPETKRFVTCSVFLPLHSRALALFLFFHHTTPHACLHHTHVCTSETGCWREIRQRRNAYTGHWFNGNRTQNNQQANTQMPHTLSHTQVHTRVPTVPQDLTPLLTCCTNDSKWHSLPHGKHALTHVLCSNIFLSPLFEKKRVTKGTHANQRAKDFTCQEGDRLPFQT